MSEVSIPLQCGQLLVQCRTKIAPSQLEFDAFIALVTLIRTMVILRKRPVTEPMWHANVLMRFLCNNCGAFYPNDFYQHNSEESNSASWERYAFSQDFNVRSQNTTISRVEGNHCGEVIGMRLISLSTLFVILLIQLSWLPPRFHSKP